MSFVTEVEAKLSEVKDKVEGDLHALILKLEGIFHRVHQAEVSGVLKQAVISDIHAAASHVESVADAVRVDVKEVVNNATKVAEDVVAKADVAVAKATDAAEAVVKTVAKKTAAK